MLAIVCSDQPNLTAPLSALLREVDVGVHATDDVFEALESARAESACALVLDARIDAADVELGLRGARRHLGPQHLVVVVGGEASGEPRSGGPVEHHSADAFAFIDVRDAIRTHAEKVADLAVQTPPRAAGTSPPIPPPVTQATRTTAADIDTALSVARTGSYYDCLGVTRGASDATVRDAAARALARFAAGSLASGLVDVRLDDLVEIRAAIRDAEAVLTDPIARRWYDRSLVSGGTGA